MGYAWIDILETFRSVGEQVADTLKPLSVPEHFKALISIKPFYFPYEFVAIFIATVLAALGIVWLLYAKQNYDPNIVGPYQRLKGSFFSRTILALTTLIFYYVAGWSVHRLLPWTQDYIQIERFALEYTAFGAVTLLYSIAFFQIFTRFPKWVFLSGDRIVLKAWLFKNFSYWAQDVRNISISSRWAVLRRGMLRKTTFYHHVPFARGLLIEFLDGKAIFLRPKNLDEALRELNSVRNIHPRVSLKPQFQEILGPIEERTRVNPRVLLSKIIRSGKR